MPQFDTIIYLTFFITFLSYSIMIYFIMSLFFIPFFWNIYYFRYLKKENNFFILFLSITNLLQFKKIILNYNLKLQNFVNLTHITFYKLNNFLFFIFINKLIKFILKVK